MASAESQPSKAASTTVSGTANTNEAPTDKSKSPAAICGVCEQNTPKYKCPRCYLPYCSVTCNRIHRENHPPDPEPTQEPSTIPIPDNKNNLDQTPMDPSNPFHALDSSSDKLKILFAKYPGLPNQLLDIHSATLPPSDTSEKPAIPASLMKALPKRDGWNHDIGIKNGKEALRKAKRAGGERGEGIREYCELIVHLMNEADANNSAKALQLQNAQQDSELIEKLLADEKR